MIGQHVSHFYILRQIGSGGMGVVYEAQDTRLPRSVAIKFLKSTLSSDTDALRRFRREAQLASSLNHPNICTILDIDELDGQSFIAMELLRGRSLKSRLTAEPLPLSEIVDIATQVADALAAAHDQGIIHRDIAPGNVFLTESGLVKILDFGLAKHFSMAESAGQTTDDLTAPGAVAGTLAYMAPEQLGGDVSVDHRCDLYSLGIVLYQMAVGARPFEVTPNNALASAIRSEPYVPVRALAPQRPAELERIIDKLLSRRPEDRYQSARALRADLDELRSIPGGTSSSPRRSWDRSPTAREFADALPAAVAASQPRTSGARWRDPVRIVLGAVAAVGLLSAAWMATRPPAAPVEPTLILYPHLIDQALTSSVAITPNGRALVYTGSAEAGKPVMIRPLDQEMPRALPGTDGGTYPNVAADGRRLALVLNRRVEVISIDGPGTLDAANGWRYGNTLWITDSTYVSDDGPTRGLTSAVVGGDTPSELTRPDSARGESRHRAGLILPGKRAVVFTVSTHGGPQVVGPLAIASLDPGAPLLPHVWLGVEARRAFAYVEGWLLYTSANGAAIMAVQLDVKRQRTFGTPVTLVQEAAGTLETASLADNGTLLYLRQPRFNAPVLVDSTGAVQWRLESTGESFMYPRLSPDDKHLTVQAAVPGGGSDVWIYDIATGSRTALTTSRLGLHPAWSPDGHHIVFKIGGGRGLMLQSVDSDAGAGLVQGSEGAFAPMVTPDGHSVLFQRHAGNGPWRVWSAPLSGTGPARPVFDDSLVHYMPAISPDGRWLADVSSETGHNEVYVRPFPGPGPAVKVSVMGGAEPAWSHDGRRIYYRVRGAFMEAVVTTTPNLGVMTRRQLFKDSFDGAMDHRNYDVARDGSGFLMLSGGSSEAVVMTNWLAKARTQLARAR